MRVLLFHGYLLEGTGSNVYNARLAAALVALGHEVHLLSQERHPERLAFVDAHADWDRGVLQLRVLREPVRCTVYRPNIGSLLPVYVADRYEGIEARTFAECTRDEVARYIDANVEAVREVIERAPPERALANHLVMGPVVLRRAFAGSPAYAVKVHGSALEYTVKPHPERFLELAREGLEGAGAILVGSRHTARSLWQALGGSEQLIARTRLGPPGVDVERFAPKDKAAATAAVRHLAGELRAGGASDGEPDSAFARDVQAAAEQLERLDLENERIVAFVGKLIVSKGVDLLLAAWPLVLEREPRARLVVVGFGAYRDALERLRDALRKGDIERARAIARQGRALESPPGPAHPLRHLLAFLDGLSAEARERYAVAATHLDQRVLLTGRLDHDELAELLPACEALVVPSTFPESFGMVAAEAAACGVFPLSAAHSGLAEVSAVLAQAIPEPPAAWLSFPIDDGAVTALAARLTSFLALDAAGRASTREALVATARAHWSWERVARGVLAAAAGALDQLEAP